MSLQPSPSSSSDRSRAGCAAEAEAAAAVRSDAGSRRPGGGVLDGGCSHGRDVVVATDQCSQAGCRLTAQPTAKRPFPLPSNAFRRRSAAKQSTRRVGWTNTPAAEAEAEGAMGRRGEGGVRAIMETDEERMLSDDGRLDEDRLCESESKIATLNVSD